MSIRYAVDVSVEVVDRPARPVADSARNLAKLAELLPEGAQLRALNLPETTGIVELQVDLDATSAADALYKLNLAMELVAMAAGGLDSLGTLHHASVSQISGGPSRTYE